MAINPETSSSADVFGTSLTIAKPSGTVEGDVLVAIVQATDPDTAITGPSGWTVIDEIRVDPSGTFFRHSTWYKVAGASEPADYTWSGADTHWDGLITRWSGVDNSTPIDVQGTESEGESTSPNGTGVTTVTDDAMLLYLEGNRDASVTNTPPTGMTEFVENNGRLTESLAYEEITTAGATGDRTGTLSASDTWAATLVALRPADVEVSDLNVRVWRANPEHTSPEVEVA